MAGNSFGKLFQLSTYGESHGAAIGGILDGCPAGLSIDTAFIQGELDKRKPGQSQLTTQRKESDTVQFLSGIFEGKSTGHPIAFQILNEDGKSKDYDHLKNQYRPSHADYVYEKKYGIRDHRGGGRSSARETACRVVAGAIAQLLLKTEHIEIHTFIDQVGEVKMNKPYTSLDYKNFPNELLACPDAIAAEAMIQEIEQAKIDGDSLGGCIQTVVLNCPVGLGEPVFDKLHADLAKAMMTINAVKGFEIGSGFAAAGMRGSAHNDEFYIENNKVRTKSNFSGGIQGGISNGEDLYFRTAFKPVATIMKDQKSINQNNETVVIKGKGRHDPCVVPRALPIVKAMCALVLADHLLRNKTAKLDL